MNCDSKARRACVDALMGHVAVDPVGAAIGGGGFGAMFAKVEMIKQGSDPTAVSAEIVADAMERTENLPLADQKRIIAKTRENVNAIHVVMIDPPEFPEGDREWRGL